MAFKKRKKSTISIKDPESLFRDLRDRKVEGLLSQQADMLRQYMKHIRGRDLALELPTGSGKTLVGLLISEWRRITKSERCLFLCPTKQLVHQAVEQALENYGINALDLSGRIRDFAEEDKTAYRNCESIGITTYSGLFNTNTFFNDTHVVIFDDAHAAENYVSSFWSMEINRYDDPKAFGSVWQEIEPYVPENDRQRCDEEEESPLDKSLVNKLPSPFLVECKNSLISAIDSACCDEQSPEEYKYKWKMIRDNLHACQLYYSGSSILIRPLIPPTKSFPPFQNARQRIYMSATLGEGGDLERIFGRKKICRIPAPEGWDKQGIGRRFFVFPMRKWDEAASLRQAIEWIPKFDRALLLTPSNRDASTVRDVISESTATRDFKLFNASELESSKKKFVYRKDAIAVLANRYDGIDLNGDECRYLIIYGLPEATNLQERFIVSRLGAAVLFNVRIRTRVTQATGRCTRSSSDYALVVIIGEKIHEYFHTPEKRETLHPELQAEVDFGIEQSNVDDPIELGENIDIFITHKVEWKMAESEILETRDELKRKCISSTKQLQDSVRHEVRYQDALWSGDFDEALSSAKDVLNSLAGGPALKGYSALWNYLAACAAFASGKKELARSHFSAAFSCVSTLPWLKQIEALVESVPDDNTADTVSGERIERLEELLEKFGKSGSGKIGKYFESIRNGLKSSESALFEEAQVKLGRLLGLKCDNREEPGDPDPWWILGSKGIVFEDYTATGENPIISKQKTLQAKGHPDTLADGHPGVTFSVVVCSTSKKIHSAAVPHVGGLFYIHVSDFIKFSEECMQTVRGLWDSFVAAGSIEWRESAAKTLSDANFGDAELFERLTMTKLSSLSEGT